MPTPWEFNRIQTDELLAACETVEQLVEAIHEREATALPVHTSMA